MVTLINLGTGLSHYEYAMTCKNGYVLSSVLCTMYYLLYLATVVLLLLNLLTGMCLRLVACSFVVELHVVAVGIWLTGEIAVIAILMLPLQTTCNSAVSGPLQLQDCPMLSCACGQNIGFSADTQLLLRIHCSLSSAVLLSTELLLA